MGRKFTEEQIRRLFPKSRGSTAQDRAAYDAKLQVLLTALETRTQAATPQAILDAQELIKRAIDDLPARNPAADGKNGNVLRLDYQFIDPVTRVEEPMSPALPTRRKSSRMLRLVSLKDLLPWLTPSQIYQLALLRLL